MTTALEKAKPTSATLTKADPKAFGEAFDAYLSIQSMIDKRMPDQIMRIGDKMFPSHDRGPCRHRRRFLFAR